MNFQFISKKSSFVLTLYNNSVPRKWQPFERNSPPERQRLLILKVTRANTFEHLQLSISIHNLMLWTVHLFPFHLFPLYRGSSVIWFTLWERTFTNEAHILNSTVWWHRSLTVYYYSYSLSTYYCYYHYSYSLSLVRVKLLPRANVTQRPLTRAWT